ncbi:MAG: alpha/beta hydrolase [Methanobacteriota archaeon]|nr:MAG: alpha/beta hydrolase [Euryarchaeota archaeon]
MATDGVGLQAMDAPVHPALRGFLDKLNALPIVPPGSLAPLARRQLFASFASGHAGDVLPMHRVEDRTLPTPDGASCNLRVYWPAAGGERPLVLYMHGGGWHAGSIATHDALCRRLAAASGCIFASLEYRMAPEVLPPTSVNDAIAAFRWLREHGAELGGDASRIALAGDSAGGSIAAAACLLLRDAPDVDVQPIAQFLIYPSTDLTASSGASYDAYADGYYLRTASVHHYGDVYLGDSGVLKTDARVSPLLASSHAQLPPAYIVTAQYDPIRSDGEAYARVLRASGVRVEYTALSGMIHAWMNMLSLSPDLCEQLHDMGKQFAHFIGYAAPTIVTAE